MRRFALQDASTVDDRVAGGHGARCSLTYLSRPCTRSPLRVTPMMNATQKSSWLTKEAGEAQREWFQIDATGHTLGRLASRIALVLRGKHKATYTPNVDMGDFVIVLNAGGIRLTGNKPEKKLYQHHTLYPGGIRTRVAKEVLADDPERAIREAVWGMMPKGPLGRRIIKKLKIYQGDTHEHTAQKPRVLGATNPAPRGAGGKN